MLTDRLDLDEEITFTFRMNYTGIVATRNVDFEIIGGYDPVTQFGGIRAGNEAIERGLKAGEVRIFDLNDRFRTADSLRVDVATIEVTEFLNGTPVTVLQDVGGDPTTGISEWFDLDGGGRIRFLPHPDGPAHLGFQSLVEFDPDGDFDDLIPLESAIVESGAQAMIMRRLGLCLMA
ncbi:MAG: hypothetical protein AB8B85_20600 [Paracoccaceae bacterium]